MDSEQSSTGNNPSALQNLAGWLNLSDIPKLGREPGFWAGLIVRSATITIFLLFLFIGGDITDMNELLFKGIDNLLHGISPYGQSYSLATFGGAFNQSYFNYPPFAIIFHLPVLLWPGPQSLGTLDFMPGFFLLHTLFDFILYYRLHQAGYSRAPLMLWVNPGMVFVDVVTFISLPLLLLTLAILNINDPVRCGLYSALLAASYQLGVIFLPFFIIYHITQKDSRRTIASMLPVLAVVLAFLVFSPITFVNDLFIAQFGRPPVNWGDSNPISPFFNRYYPMGFLFMGSVPALVFNFAIGLGVSPALAPRIAFPMLLLVGVITIIFLIHFILNPRRGLAILYPGILLVLLIASMSEGIAHYWVLTITLPFLAWNQRHTFFSSPTASTTGNNPHHAAPLAGEKPKSQRTPSTKSRREARMSRLPSFIRRAFESIDLDFGERLISKFGSLPFVCDIRRYTEFWPLLKDQLTLELGSERGFGSKGVASCVRTDLRPINGVDVVCDATNLPFRDDVFDRTWCVYLMHHVPNIHQLLLESKRVSRKAYFFDFTPRTWLHYFSIVWDRLFFGDKIHPPSPKALRDMAPELRVYPQGALGGVLYAL